MIIDRDNRTVTLTYQELINVFEAGSEYGGDVVHSNEWGTTTNLEKPNVLMDMFELWDDKDFFYNELPW